MMDTMERPAHPVMGAGDVAGHDRRSVALVILVIALFLAQGWTAIGAELGDSHDGRNAAVWSMGSESLREVGPVASRLGTRTELGGTYANHPPLIYLETALAEVVGGPARAATRAPAWLGSLATIVLLTVMLRDAGLRIVSAAVGVTAVAITPMFLVYGTMLDTPVTSLPFGVSLLLVAQRLHLGRRVHPLVAFTLAVLAPLSGWQSLILAALVGAWAGLGLVRGARQRPPRLALVGGALTGFVALAVWMLWAFDGSVDTLVQQFLFRTGQSTIEVGYWELLQLQLVAVHAMFGLVLVAVAAAGLLLALRGHRFRALAGATLLVTLPYPVLFPVGAVIHDYWNYWFLLPLSVGIAVGFDLVLEATAGRPMVERAAPLMAGLMAVSATVAMSLSPPPPEQMIVDGVAAGEVLVDARFPADQEEAWYVGRVGSPPRWLTLATGRPARALEGNELAGLARSRPHDVVFVSRTDCARKRSYTIETAQQVANDPPIDPRGCPTR